MALERGNSLSANICSLRLIQQILFLLGKGQELLLGIMIYVTLQDWI